MKNKFLLLSLLSSLSFGVAAGLTLNEKSTKVEKAVALHVDTDDGSTENNHAGDVFPAGTNFWVDEMSDTYDVDIYYSGQILDADTISNGIPFTFPDVASLWVLERMESSSDGHAGYLLFYPLYKVTVEDKDEALLSWQTFGGYGGSYEGDTYAVAGEWATLSCTLTNSKGILLKGEIRNKAKEIIGELELASGKSDSYKFMMPECDVTLVPHIHVHDFDLEHPQGSGQNIYIPCKGANCPLESSRARLFIFEGSTLTYTGENLNPGNASQAIFDFEELTGASVTVTYYVWDPIEYKTVGEPLKSVKEPGTYKMIFEVGTASASFTFTVDKANPEVTAPSESISATYGQTVYEIISNNASNVTEGVWSVENPDRIITPIETSDGPIEVNVKFTPTDTDHYKVLDFKTYITITKGPYTPEQNSETIHIGNYVGQTATVTIPLPDGFALIANSLVNPNPEYFAFEIIGSNNVSITVIKEFTSELGSSFDFTLQIGESPLYNNYTYTVTLEPTWHTHGVEGQLTPKVDPDCEHSGTKSYYKCSCGLYYTDSSCSTLIGDDAALAAWLVNPEGGFIAALGHDWSEVTYTFDKKAKTWTASRVCSRDAGHVETETVDAVKENGLWVGRFTNSAFLEQSIKAGLGGGAIAGIVIGSFLFAVIAAYATLNVLYNKKQYVVPVVGQVLVPAFKFTNTVCKKIADFAKDLFTKFIGLFKKQKSE